MVIGLLLALISLQIGIIFRDVSIIKYTKGVKLLMQKGPILEINIL